MEDVKVNPLPNQGAGDAIPYLDIPNPVPQDISPEITSIEHREEPLPSPLVATDSGFSESPPTRPIFLHQCGQCPSLPSFQSDCLKVCTWLRATNTNFHIFNHKLNFDGRFPMVDIGDVEICNSGQVLTDLTGQLNRDLDAELSDEQKILAFSLGSLIENTLAREHREWYRTKRADLIRAYKIDLRKSLKKILPNAILKVFFKNSSSKKPTTNQITVPESTVVLEMLSKLLSSKNYFFGQDIVSSLDVVAFAVLAPMLAIAGKVRYDPRDAVKQNFENLVAFVDRIKDRFYPDWEEMCSEGCEVNMNRLIECLIKS
ncbi:failed axon connections-like [Ochlerotatus camptorhynchus]|uniref:failed axon connections-like n=1 Tax=Ochlerotatus camptorhynchus TaxID=644619 RepID=UPI0031D30AD7